MGEQGEQGDGKEMNWGKIIMIVMVLLAIGGAFLYAWAEMRDAPIIKKFCEDKGGKIIREKCAISNQDGAYTLYNIQSDWVNNKKEYILTR